MTNEIQKTDDDKYKYWPKYERNGIVHGRGSTDKWRDQRRAVMVEIINNDATKNWSIRDITEAMLEHPLIQQVQPKLSKSTVHRDWLAVKDELAEKRVELAGDYIDYHLNITDYLLNDLMSDYQAIDSIDTDNIEDEELRARILLDRIGDKEKIIRSIERMMKRQSTLVPIEVPKKLEIDDNKTVTFYSERFIEIQKRANMELSDGIEDGDFVEVDD